MPQHGKLPDAATAVAGVERVLQLEGGILKYFEQTDGAPGWRGGCFASICP